MTNGDNNLSFNHLPIGDRAGKPIEKPPLVQVDAMADQLVADHVNPEYRRWYCGVIYEFGITKVEEWRRRAQEGNEPSRLFSKYVAEARLYRQSRRTQ